LSIVFDGHDGEPKDYVRELDVGRSLARVSYQIGAMRYRASIFAAIRPE